MRSATNVPPTNQIAIPATCEAVISLFFISIIFIYKIRLFWI